jgi:membrane protein CcdC involved in cytochrome C biogenesis
MKYKKLVNINDEQIGIGDIAFLITIAFLFSPVNFILFLLLSLTFSLLFVMTSRFILPNKFKTIPLAGLQAVFLLGLLITILLVNKNWNTNNDEQTVVVLLDYVGIN